MIYLQAKRVTEVSKFQFLKSTLCQRPGMAFGNHRTYTDGIGSICPWWMFSCLPCGSKHGWSCPHNPQLLGWPRPAGSAPGKLKEDWPIQTCLSRLDLQLDWYIRSCILFKQYMILSIIKSSNWSQSYTPGVFLIQAHTQKHLCILHEKTCNNLSKWFSLSYWHNPLSEKWSVWLGLRVLMRSIKYKSTNQVKGWPLPIRLPCHHDDVIKWKHFPRYWPFVRGIHRSPVNSHHKGQWRWAFIFPLICAWTAEQTIETLVISNAIVVIITSL